MLRAGAVVPPALQEVASAAHVQEEGSVGEGWRTRPPGRGRGVETQRPRKEGQAKRKEGQAKRHSALNVTLI